jgi:transcriptional regulator with XRE-family HTH domain
MPTPTRSLREVLAAGARAARKRLGLRQDDAAARLRAHGLTSWLRGTVAQAETGSRRFSLEDLLLLAIAYDAPVADLVAGADEDLIELSPGVRLTVGAVRALLSGDQATIHRLHQQGVDAPREQAAARSGRFPDVLAEARRFGIRRHADVDRAVTGIGDSERYAARKLGTTPERINLAALASWGRTLAEERDHRVQQQGGDAETTPRGLQALRGHVTRELLTELETILSQKGLI